MADNFNTKFAQSLLKHDIDLMRVEAGARQEILGVLKGLEKQTISNIQKFGTPKSGAASAVNKQLNILVGATADTSKKAYDQMKNVMGDTMIKTGAVQTDMIVNELDRALTVDLGTKKLSLEVLKTLPGKSLIEGAPMEQWFNKQNADWQNRFLNEMREGMINGESIEDMTRRVRGTQAAGFKDGIMQTSRREAQTLTRSSVLAGANKAREQTYLANKDIIKGQQWLATLDSRTSDICISLDGSAWFLSGKAMPGTVHDYLGPPPAHFNCRSTLVPVTKSFSELAKNPKTKSKLAQMPPRDRNKLRASMDGAVSEKLNYEEWLSVQPPAFQVQVLGPTKFRMWQAGQLPLRELIDQSHNPINIDTLIAQHGSPAITLDSALEKAAHSQVVAGTKFDTPEQWYNKFGKTDVTVDEILEKEGKATIDKLDDTQKRLDKSKTTAQQFKNADGTWDAQRVTDVHDKIIAEILNPAAIARATPTEGIAPRYAVFGGRGGSGKGALTKSKKDGGLGLFGDDFINLNVDDIKEAIKASNGAKGYEGWNAFNLHEESSAIFARIDEMAREKGLNVIHDITMRSINTPMKRLLAYETAGYEVEGYYMFLPPEEAAKRAIGRFRGYRNKFDGRYVPPDIVLGNTVNEANFAAMSKRFKKWEFYDNQGNKPRLVGKGGVPAEVQVAQLKTDITKYKKLVEDGQKPPAQVQASFDSLSAAEQKLVKDDIEATLTKQFEAKAAELKVAQDKAATAAAEAAAAQAEIAAAEAATAAVEAAEVATAKVAEDAAESIMDKIIAQKATFEKRAYIKLAKADEQFQNLSSIEQLQQIGAQVEIDKAKKQVSDGIVNYKKAVVAGKMPPPAALKVYAELPATKQDEIIKAIEKTKAAKVAAAPAKPLNQVIEEYKANKLTHKEFVIEYHKAKSTLNDSMMVTINSLDDSNIKIAATTILDGFDKTIAENIPRTGTATVQAAAAKDVKKMAATLLDTFVDAKVADDFIDNYKEFKFALHKLEKKLPAFEVDDVLDLAGFSNFDLTAMKQINDTIVNKMQALIASDATAIEFATTSKFVNIPVVKLAKEVKPPSVTTVRKAANDVVKNFISGDAVSTYEFNYLAYKDAFGKLADDILTHEQWTAQTLFAKKHINSDILKRMASLLEDTGATAKQFARSGKLEDVPLLIDTGGKAAVPKVGKNFKNVAVFQDEAQQLQETIEDLIDTSVFGQSDALKEVNKFLGIVQDVEALQLNEIKSAFFDAKAKLGEVIAYRASAIKTLKKLGATPADEVAGAAIEATTEVKAMMAAAKKLKTMYDVDELTVPQFKKQAAKLLGKEGLDLSDSYVAVDWAAGDIASAQEAITANKKILAAMAQPEAATVEAVAKQLAVDMQKFQKNAAFSKNLFDTDEMSATNFKKTAAKLLGIEDLSSVSMSKIYDQLNNAINDPTLAKTAIAKAQRVAAKAQPLPTPVPTPPKTMSVFQVQDDAQQLIEDFRFGKFGEKEALEKAAKILGQSDELPALMKLEGTALDNNLDLLMANVKKVANDKDIAAFHIKQGGLTVADDIPTVEFLKEVVEEAPKPTVKVVKEVVEPSPAPATVTEATAPPDMDNITRISQQQGSNPGGTFQDTTTGQKWYIKTPASADVAQNEVLAGKLYELLGIEVPEMHIVTQNGKASVASKIIDGLDTNPTLLKAGRASGIGEGFAADAWLGNWDVIGLGYDNMLLKAGRVIRVDTGGALRYRAQGGLKGKSFGKKVDEIDSLRNPSNNPQAASVFGDLTEEEMKAGARRIANVSDGDIRDLVIRYGPDSAGEQKELIDILIARKKDIKKRFNLRASPKTKKTGQAAKPPKDIGDAITQAETQQITEARSNGFVLNRDGEGIEDQAILAWSEKTTKGVNRSMLQLKVRGKTADALNASIEVTVDKALPAIPTTNLDNLIERSVVGLKHREAKGAQALYDDTIKARLRETVTEHKAVRDKIESEIAVGRLQQADLDKFDAQFADWVEGIRITEMSHTVGETVVLTDFPAGRFARGGVGDLQPVAVKVAGDAPPKIKWVEKDGAFERKQVRHGHTIATDTTQNYGRMYEAVLDDDITIRFFSGRLDGQPFALADKVDVIAPGKTHEQALAALRRLGINVERATDLNAEELYLRQIMRHNRDGFSTFNATINRIKDPQKRLARARELASKELGMDITTTPNYNFNGQYQAFGHGNKNLFRPDIFGREWDEFVEGHKLTHNVTQGNSIAEALDNILNSGGQMAPTTDKLRRGIPVGGMSPSSDLATGGASYFFTRVATTQSAKRSTGFVWKSSLLRRLDSISYTSDKYGKVTGNFVQSNRKTGVREWSNLIANSGNETIFKNSLSLFDEFEAIVVNSELQRKEVLKVLKKHKIERWPDGRTLDEVVIVS